MGTMRNVRVSTVSIRYPPATDGSTRTLREPGRMLGPRTSIGPLHVYGPQPGSTVAPESGKNWLVTTKGVPSLYQGPPDLRISKDGGLAGVLGAMVSPRTVLP